MFAQAQQRLQATLLKIVFLKGICKHSVGAALILRGIFLGFILECGNEKKACEKTTTLNEERKGDSQTQFSKGLT